MFAALFHADWSTGRDKRWAVFALSKTEGWHVEAPFAVPVSDQLLDILFNAGAKGPVLAGFDFPIGVPFSYGTKTGLVGFPVGPARVRNRAVGCILFGCRPAFRALAQAAILSTPLVS
ncbi:MAG: hypothetical protein ACJ8DU_24680 [Microvirga sp.]